MRDSATIRQFRRHWRRHLEYGAISVSFTAYRRCSSIVSRLRNSATLQWGAESTGNRGSLCGTRDSADGSSLVGQG